MSLFSGLRTARLVSPPVLTMPGPQTIPDISATLGPSSLSGIQWPTGFTFQWTCTVRPSGASVNFDAPQSETTDVTVGRNGTYNFRLCVSNGYQTTCASQIITFTGA